MSTRVIVKFTDRQATLVRELLLTATDEHDPAPIVTGAIKAVERALLTYGTHDSALAVADARATRVNPPGATS
jgi:hypothetical protein